MSEAVHADDLRDTFLQVLAAYAHYWATLEGKTPHERCNGLAFSMLAIIDGSNMSLPSFDLVARPHPDDKLLLQAEGSDWIEDGTIISDGGLHEVWHRYEIPAAPDEGTKP